MDLWILHGRLCVNARADCSDVDRYTRLPTSECVTCDKEHHCTKGGAEPGALTVGTRDVAWGGGGAVFDPGTISPVKVTSSLSARAAALAP